MLRYPATSREDVHSISIWTLWLATPHVARLMRLVSLVSVATLTIHVRT
jgi:hypothetical protein